MINVSSALAGLVSAARIVRCSCPNEPSSATGPPVTAWISVLPRLMNSRHGHREVRRDDADDQTGREFSDAVTGLDAVAGHEHHATSDDRQHVAGVDDPQRSAADRLDLRQDGNVRHDQERRGQQPPQDVDDLGDALGHPSQDRVQQG
ncbi:hypothetical protein [Polymorphospora sp. A560]|uniref:hypothetical protein n=1 Tax=Polymorphospora sp. A560 TaxID=3040203 RepID=UPI0038923511